MENVKTIKGVDGETWIKFKELAAKKRMRMGDLFGSIVREYEKISDDFWEEILSGERRISDEEAKEMLKDVRELRKEEGFRI